MDESGYLLKRLEAGLGGRQVPSFMKDPGMSGFGLLLVLLCLAAAAIAVLAWCASLGLYGLGLLLLLPLLICKAPSRSVAFWVAWTYYAVAMRSVPGIICGFFPQLSGLTCLLLWFSHASVLALPWVLAYKVPGSSGWRAVLKIFMALLILSVPPVGLFHWGSPLMAAGLLFPGWSWMGLLMTIGLLSLLVAGSWCSRFTWMGLTAVLSLSVLANVSYEVPAPPPGWRAISLTFGRSPELWSDLMTERRTILAKTALHELELGARVVIFPESISGSNRRPQHTIWQDVASFAQAKNATVLVGEEHWTPGTHTFRNALVIYGKAGANGEVFVSSQVPMPVGEWKFGAEDGADTDLFGDDVRHLQGQAVAFSLCYEDFLLWPHRGLLSGQATLLVSVSNQWPSANTSAEISQDLSRMALARLAGVPLLTAKNH